MTAFLNVAGPGRRGADRDYCAGSPSSPDWLVGWWRAVRGVLVRTRLGADGDQKLMYSGGENSALFNRIATLSRAGTRRRCRTASGGEASAGLMPMKLLLETCHGCLWGPGRWYDRSCPQRAHRGTPVPACVCSRKPATAPRSRCGPGAGGWWLMWQPAYTTTTWSGPVRWRIVGAAGRPGRTSTTGEAIRMAQAPGCRPALWLTPPRGRVVHRSRQQLEAIRRRSLVSRTRPKRCTVAEDLSIPGWQPDAVDQNNTSNPIHRRHAQEEATASLSPQLTLRPRPGWRIWWSNWNATSGCRTVAMGHRRGSITTLCPPRIRYWGRRRSGSNPIRGRPWCGSDLRDSTGGFPLEVCTPRWDAEGSCTSAVRPFPGLYALPDAQPGYCLGYASGAFPVMRRQVSTDAERVFCSVKG